MRILHQLKLLGSALGPEVGWTWPVLLIVCLVRGEAIARKTHWSSPCAPTAEARYVRRLALFPALYLELVARLGAQEALDKYQRIVTAFGYALQRDALASVNVAYLAGIQRFMAFRGRMDQSEADRFNVKEYVSVTDTSCHYVLRRCIAHDFFSEVGTAQLTRFFCHGDETFFRDAFPDLTFTRGDSWENTIAYGKDHCEYLLAMKEPG